MYLMRSIDPCLYKMVLPVYTQLQTGWATFVAMKDVFHQRLYKPQVEVVREMSRAWDLLIDLKKVALHPALTEEWKVVSNLNVGIVEALELKEPVLVALFIARRLGETTASEKTGVIRTAHGERKELKARGGKSEFVELANRIIPSPGHGSVWGAPPRPAHPSHHPSGGFGGRVFSSDAVDFGRAYIGGAYGGGGGHAGVGPGHYDPTNGLFHRGRGGRGSRGGYGGGSGRGPAVCRKCVLAGSTSTNHPHTICLLHGCFKCGKSGPVH